MKLSETTTTMWRTPKTFKTVHGTMNIYLPPSGKQTWQWDIPYRCNRKIICKWSILHCHVWLWEGKHFISNLYAFIWDTLSSLYIDLKDILQKESCSCSFYRTNLYQMSIIFCRRTISRNPQKSPEKTVQQPLHRRWGDAGEGIQNNEPWKIPYPPIPWNTGWSIGQ